MSDSVIVRCEACGKPVNILPDQITYAWEVWQSWGPENLEAVRGDPGWYGLRCPPKAGGCGAVLSPAAIVAADAIRDLGGTR